MAISLFSLFAIPDPPLVPRLPMDHFLPFFQSSVFFGGPSPFEKYAFFF